MVKIQQQVRSTDCWATPNTKCNNASVLDSFVPIVFLKHFRQAFLCDIKGLMTTASTSASLARPAAPMSTLDQSAAAVKSELPLLFPRSNNESLHLGCAEAFHACQKRAYFHPATIVLKLAIQFDSFFAPRSIPEACAARWRLAGRLGVGSACWESWHHQSRFSPTSVPTLPLGVFPRC